jgi:hypothetical protein
MSTGLKRISVTCRNRKNNTKDTVVCTDLNAELTNCKNKFPSSLEIEHPGGVNPFSFVALNRLGNPQSDGVGYLNPDVWRIYHSCLINSGQEDPASSKPGDRLDQRQCAQGVVLPGTSLDRPTDWQDFHQLYYLGATVCQVKSHFICHIHMVSRC